MVTVDMPPWSMFTQYMESDLSEEDVQHLFELVSALSQVNIWRGADNSYSPEAWRELSIVSHPPLTVKQKRGVCKVPWCPGIYIVSCTNADAGVDVDVNLADIICLNRIPCKVLRSLTQTYEDGWEWVSNVEPFPLRGDTVVMVQKMHSITDYAGDTHVRMLTKVCTLHTLLQWQLDAKKTVLKEENDGQLATPASQSAGEQGSESGH